MGVGGRGVPSGVGWASPRPHARSTHLAWTTDWHAASPPLLCDLGTPASDQGLNCRARRAPGRGRDGGREGGKEGAPQGLRVGADREHRPGPPPPTAARRFWPGLWAAPPREPPPPTPHPAWACPFRASPDSQSGPERQGRPGPYAGVLGWEAAPPLSPAPRPGPWILPRLTGVQPRTPRPSPRPDPPRGRLSEGGPGAGVQGASGRPPAGLSRGAPGPLPPTRALTARRGPGQGGWRRTRRPSPGRPGADGGGLTWLPWGPSALSSRPHPDSLGGLGLGLCRLTPAPRAQPALSRAGTQSPSPPTPHALVTVVVVAPPCGLHRRPHRRTHSPLGPGSLAPPSGPHLEAHEALRPSRA